MRAGARTGPAAAHAAPSFTLLQADAAPGEKVGFNISGTEPAATYVLEVDGDEVAEGSVPADGVGDFTMPNLGAASRSVTVEARIEESDETTSRARNLHYLASRVSAGSAAATVPAVAAPVASTPTAPPALASQKPARRRSPAKGQS